MKRLLLCLLLLCAALGAEPGQSGMCYLTGQYYLTYDGSGALVTQGYVCQAYIYMQASAAITALGLL